MAVIWLSPRLPADHAALAASLGPDTEISSAPLPPGGASVAVATVFERPLLEQLATVRGAGALLLLKPPGTATPADLPVSDGPATVVEASDVAGVAAAIRSALADPPAPWPAPFASAAAPSGWLLGTTESPTGELPVAEGPAAVPAAAGAGRSRRNWLASGGVIGVAALAAVVVLATQGGASGTSQSGFRGPGGFAGGYGFGTFPGGPPGGGSSGGSSSGQGTLPGAGQLPNSGSGSSGTDDATRAAQRQAFLDCLQKNGVDTSTLSQGQRPRLDPSDPTMASALQACRSLRPHRGDGVPPGGAGGPGMGFPGGPGGMTGSTGGIDTPGTATAPSGRTT